MDPLFTMFYYKNNPSEPSAGHVEACSVAMFMAGASFYRCFGISASPWADLGAQMARPKAPNIPKKGTGRLKKSLETAFLPQRGLKVLSRVPADP